MEILRVDLEGECSGREDRVGRHRWAVAFEVYEPAGSLRTRCELDCRNTKAAEPDPAAASTAQTRQRKQLRLTPKRLRRWGWGGLLPLPLDGGGDLPFACGLRAHPRSAWASGSSSWWYLFGGDEIASWNGYCGLQEMLFRVHLWRARHWIGSVWTGRVPIRLRVADCRSGRHRPRRDGPSVASAGDGRRRLLHNWSSS